MPDYLRFVFGYRMVPTTVVDLRCPVRYSATGSRRPCCNIAYLITVGLIASGDGPTLRTLRWWGIGTEH